jgi:DNA-binding transcriptional ArsR family regulator
MTDPQRLARAFKVLGADSRVRILQLLKKRVLCVDALAKRLQMTPAAVSQHLRILRDAELVTPDKRGYYVHYRVKKKTLARWQKMADQLLGTDAG